MGNKLKCKKEVVSLSAMAAMELMGVILATLYKASAVDGLSYFALIIYSHLIGSLLLLPLLFIFPRQGVPPLFTFPILTKFVLLAFVGFAASVCGYKGIQYTSPTIASCISNLIPAFTFIFAVVFGFENVDFRSKKTIAKTVGTFVSISGALVTILFKGPAILSNFSVENLLQSFNTDWVLGGLLLAGSGIFCSLAFILQTQVVKSYPNEITVALVMSILVAVLAALLGPIIEKTDNFWTLGSGRMALVTVILTGVFGPSLTTAVHTWGLNMKGPLYVSIFKPFSIVIAAVLGVSFLGDTLYLGSLIGAVIILLGFYAVIWGKTDEVDEEPKHFTAVSYCGPSSSSSSDIKVPLLTSYEVEDIKISRA